MFKFVLLVLFLSYSVQATTECPLNWLQVQLETDFDFGKFMGTWYDIYYHEPTKTVTTDEKMDNHDLNLRREGSSNSAKVTLHSTEMQNERCHTSDASGTMRLEADASNPAKLKFVRSRQGEKDSHFWVVETDYSTYAVVLQCPWNNLRGGNCSSGTEIDILARQEILIDESRVRKLVYEKLCDDFDNNFYEVYHNRNCASGAIKLAMFNLFFVIPWLLLIVHVSWT